MWKICCIQTENELEKQISEKSLGGTKTLPTFVIVITEEAFSNQTSLIHRNQTLPGSTTLKQLNL